jgi:hypothetical protein
VPYGDPRSAKIARLEIVFDGPRAENRKESSHSAPSWRRRDSIFHGALRARGLLGERSRLGSSQAASRIFIDPKGEQFVKKTAPSFLIALALIVLATAGAAVAQNDMGNVATTGATFTVGVVDSFGANSVTLKKDSGDVVTILLEDATVGKDHLVNGNRVRIDYVLDDQNQAVAQEIEINGDRVAETTAIEAPAVEAPVVETETEVAVETPAPAPAETYTAPAPAAPAPAIEAEPAPMPEPTPEALPATASRLGAFALLGLLALASGVAIRLAR